MDPRTANGAVFLGVNGIVIKSHGGTDEIGFKSALGLTYEMAHNQLIKKIGEGLKEYAAHDAELANDDADQENNDNKNNEVGSA